jgi:pSer/pThr/pTyr-binding forkhead associated (FHA) protein
MTGQSYELKVDKTTIGRVEDNTFPIVQPSISSHHCEVLLRGNDVVIKDLNSTNGAFINIQRVTTEGGLKPGQILRLGQVELRLETGAPAAASKKPVDSTMIISKGVSLEQLEQGPQAGFDTSKGGFSKKKKGSSTYIIWGAVVLVVIILGVILIVATQLGGNSGK